MAGESFTATDEARDRRGHAERPPLADRRVHRGRPAAAGGRHRLRPAQRGAAERRGRASASIEADRERIDSAVTEITSELNDARLDCSREGAFWCTGQRGSRLTVKTCAFVARGVTSVVIAGCGDVLGSRRKARMSTPSPRRVAVPQQWDATPGRSGSALRPAVRSDGVQPEAAAPAARLGAGHVDAAWRCRPLRTATAAAL